MLDNSLSLKKTFMIGDTSYELIKSSEVIEADSSSGKKYWQGHIVADATGEYYTCSSAWRTTKKGISAVVWSTPYYAEPTNVGRANERNNKDQAYFDFDSMVKKQTDKRKADKPLPMLAQTFIHKTKPEKSRRHKIVYPCAVQRKYDGLRMLSTGDEVWSRGNKPFPEQVTEHILPFLPNGHITDGEFLLPGKHAVGDVNSAVKRFQPGISDTLYYVIYDLVIEDLPFSERIKLAEAIVAEANNPNIVFAETFIAQNEAEVLALHERFVAEGYEGTIVRNLAGKYAINKRVDDVQKLKDWVTEEFEIVDIIPSGGGVAAEVGKYICKSPPEATEPTFESTATGDEDFRRRILSHKEEYIGKFAVVKYRELTKYGQPFHSNVLEIRETKTGGY